MRTSLSIMILLSLILGSLLLTPVRAAPPVIKRPMELYEATIQGASIRSVDPARAYDTASGELIQNVYDTLLIFDGERVDRFLPSVAVNWTSFPINETGPEGQQWNYRYVFQIRAGVVFQPPYNYSLTPDDVEYSFEREMVQDASWGPAWMLYQPLLYNASGAAGLGNGNLSDPVNVQYVGRLIDHAVESNATHVWFNIMFPGTYSPFLKILCQTWGSILSRQWIVNQVIGGAGRPDWTGYWSMSHIGWGLDHTEWIDHYNPVTSPLDSFARMMYGSGPFILQTLDESNKFWLLNRNVMYWRGWPADYPTMVGASPAGYVDTVRCTWAYTWTDSLSMFLNGDVDFIAVPRQHLAELYQSATPPYDPPNYPIDGVRCVHPLPELLVDALFFEFAIDPATSYTAVGPPGQFSENLIPVDFFGNPTWGIHVRKAFSYAIDYDMYLQQATLGEAQHPATAIVPGLPYFDATVQGYSYNRTREILEFQVVPGLWDTGFNITIQYLEDSLPRNTLESLLKSEIEAVNPKFHVYLKGISWSAYLMAAAARQLPLFTMDWLADYADPADVAVGFYRTGGEFASWQAYSNPAMDALIDQGIAIPDGPARQAVYSQIQQLAINECPSATISQPMSRHFERDWVVGWYYNPSYPGINFYNLWKWYYVPASRLDTSTQPAGYNLPADVNYDGKVDMRDIGVVAKSFGALAGPPLDPSWVFRADVNLDRKVDMKDIGYVAKQFGKNSPKWTPT